MQNSTKPIQQLITVLVCITLLVQLTSCGTILYPERRGQKPDAAQIDVKVVILDGALLLLFLVPGVIAYAVDFATGCIYLPPGRIVQNSGDLRADDLQVIHLDPEQLNADSITRIIQARTGYSIPLSAPEMLVFNPNTLQIAIQQELVRLNAGHEPLAEGNWFAGSQLTWVTDIDGRLSRIEVAIPKTEHNVNYEGTPEKAAPTFLKDGR